MNSQSLPDSDIVSLAREMAARGEWRWVSRLTELMPDRFPPNEVLSIVCAQGGQETGENLALAMLDRGADPSILVEGPNGWACPLAYAALAGQSKLVDRLLDDPRAPDWLSMPVGKWPLLHALMTRRARWPMVARLLERGLPRAQAEDGSAAWEHRLPSSYESKDTLHQMRELNLLPTTAKELEEGSRRCRLRANRTQLVDVERALAGIAEASSLGQSPMEQRLAMVGSFVGLPKTISEYSALAVPAPLLDESKGLSANDWLTPVNLLHPKALAGTWTLLGAVAWSHGMQGPRIMAQYAGHKESAVSAFDPWSVLAAASPTAPLWTSPLGKPKSGVSMLGLAVLNRLEATHVKSVALKSGEEAMPFYRGDLSRPDAAAAFVRTMLDLLPHVGAHRRSKIADMLFPMVLNDANLKKAAQASHVESLATCDAGDRLRLALTLLSHQRTISSGQYHQDFWNLLTQAGPKVWNKLTASDWRSIQRWSQQQPGLVMPSWDQKRSPLWDHVPAQLIVSTRQSEHPPVPAGLSKEKTDQLVKNWELLIRVLGKGEPGLEAYRFSHHWANQLTVHMASGAQSLPAKDWVTWLASVFDNEKGGVPADILWSQLRRYAATGEAPLAVVPGVQKQIEAGLTSDIGSLLGLWTADIESNDPVGLYHPRADFTKMGLDLPESWAQKLLESARQRNHKHLSQMEAQDRDLRAQAHTPRPSTRQRRRS